ncbi:hypothetical protein CBL_04357 [Carabus blaptoides fortunei]
MITIHNHNQFTRNLGTPVRRCKLIRTLLKPLAPPPCNPPFCERAECNIPLFPVSMRLSILGCIPHWYKSTITCVVLEEWRIGKPITKYYWLTNTRSGETAVWPGVGQSLNKSYN